MAYFPPSFLDEVLSRTDLIEVVGRHVELKKSGANFMGLCPFHHEKSPSFSVSADKQLFYCFGCGKGGGAYQFLMEHDGYSFPEAVEYLAEKAGLDIPKQAVGAVGDNEKRNRALSMLAKVSDVFVRQLVSEPGAAARHYLQQRQLPEEIVRKYRLGFAPAGYGFMQQCFGGDAITLAQLEAIGVLFKGERGYVDRFRNRLMFPICDRRGKVVGFGGRVLADEKTAKYLNSPETEFFHKSDLLYGLAEHRDEIRKRKMLLVVEGYMDVLALAAHDLPIAIAPLGTAIGEKQIQELLRLHNQPVFCFDGDRAGKQAAWRALERMLPILKSEHDAKFLYLPDGEDPDSMVAKEGAHAFCVRMQEQAKPILETWLQGLQNLAGQGAGGRARMAKKADAMLAIMQDDYLRQAWRQEAEKATKIQLQQTGNIRSIDDAKRWARKGVVRQMPSNAVQDSFMAGLLQKASRFQQLSSVEKELFLDDEDVNRLYRRALDMLATQDVSDLQLLHQLQQAFPDNGHIARWMNQPTIDDQAFGMLLLDVRLMALQQTIRQEKNFSEVLRKKRELMALQKQQKELQAELEEQRGSDE